jgi:monoamine oxidase
VVKNYDVVVIGAGVAGLTAAAKLGNTGFSVSILEARNRIGGRVFTQRDPVLDAPIELGAEFIHGKAPEIFDLLTKSNVAITEIEGDTWCSTDGRLSQCDFFDSVDKILKKMDDSGPDESFHEYLERCWKNPDYEPHLEEAKRRATGYVSGFNAADPRLVGVHWLVKEARAEEDIEGDRAFRAAGGYASLIAILEQNARKAGVLTELETIVKSIEWKPGIVEVSGFGAAGPFTIAAQRVLITVPLAVLQAKSGELGAIEFRPALSTEKLDALQKLEMGKAVRVTLRFRSRFWKDLPSANGGKNFERMSFLLSQDEWMPTWWTAMPNPSPIITGWATFRWAEKISGKDENFVVNQCLESLARVLGISEKQVKTEFETAYFHDWQRDPFSRGAYSYGKVGSDGAQQALAAPIANTLFFAGEASDISGNNGTVQAALASGERAASEILNAQK